MRYKFTIAWYKAATVVWSHNCKICQMVSYKVAILRSCNWAKVISARFVKLSFKVAILRVTIARFKVVNWESHSWYKWSHNCKIKPQLWNKVAIVRSRNCEKVIIARCNVKLCYKVAILRSCNCEKVISARFVKLWALKSQFWESHNC